MGTARVRVLGVLIAALALAGTATAQVPVQVGDDQYTKPSIAVGGQIRQQYEWFANEEWGAAVPDSNGYWLQRYMFRADVRVARRLRLFGELKSGIEVGRTGGPRPPDEDELDVHQAFVDVSFGPLTARVGRQELAFGSQRLVAVREGPNMRQTFDAVDLVVALGRWRVNALGARYVSTEHGLFDDSSDTGRSLWGVYAVRPLNQAGTEGVEVYYLGYRRANATFDQGEGQELRHSWGVRVWKVSDDLYYNVEALAQTGSFADARIRAWTIASDTSYHLPLAGHPRVGLRADVTSGDRDRHDDRLGTFNPLFPNGAYFGLIASAGIE